MQIIIFMVLFSFVSEIYGSAGDRSPYFRSCIETVAQDLCENNVNIFKNEFAPNQINSLMLWTCHDECKYKCMWKTVDGFTDRGWNTPQFYGKWPFARFLGMQEPASVIFSMMNFYVHFRELLKFRSKVRRSAPFYWMWHLSSMISLNGWIWSIVFHSRDFPFTEFMDYSSAFCIVLSYFYCLGMRLLHNKHRNLSILFSFLCISFLVSHVSYLKNGNFDYEYNMIANTIIGTSAVIGWLSWCFWNYKEQPYVKKCAMFMIVSGIVTLVLELADFPPILWAIDAHALWHLCTAFLPIWFYSFIIEDCKFLSKQEQMEKELQLFEKRL